MLESLTSLLYDTIPGRNGCCGSTDVAEELTETGWVLSLSGINTGAKLGD